MAAKGFYVNYGSEITFINRIADNIDNTGVSNIDNFISPKDKEFIIKNNEINAGFDRSLAIETRQKDMQKWAINGKLENFKFSQKHK